MSESAVGERRRPRRTAIVVVAAVVVVAIIAAIVVIRVLTPSVGIQAALGSADFTQCLSIQGTPDDEPSLEGADSWSVDEERAFWAHPLALHCASLALAEDRRERALSVAFLSRDDGGDLYEQWQWVADYATWLEQDGVERDIALLRLAGLIRAIWVAEADQSNWAYGFCEVAVLADLRARGELPGYEPWLAGTGSEDTANSLERYSTDDLGKDRPENEEPFDDFFTRSRALLEVVR